MYKQDYLTTRVLTGTATILFSIILYIVIFSLAPSLKSYSLFHRNVITSYLSFFIPLNVISWLALGQLGGISILILSCLSVIFSVLRGGGAYHNSYILLFGISAIVGHRLFLGITISRSRSLAKLEELETDRNTLAAKVSENQMDREAFKNRVQRYAALKRITEDLSSTLDLEETVNLIVERAFDIIGSSDRAFLFLINETRQELELFALRQADGEPYTKTGTGEIFDTWILKQRRPLMIEDLDNDFRFSPEALTDPQDREFKSIIAVPLMCGMKITGVLRMDSRRSRAYAQDDLRLLDIVSDLAAVSIENAMLYRRTNELAITDGLTGLYVQRFFKGRLEEELKKVSRDNERFSILMIDLDYFKEYNDRYGHAAGDILLIRIAEALKAGVGAGHIVSRYGGEEFAIFLSGFDKKKALKISEELRRNIEGSIFTLRRSEVKVTISIGFSSFPDDAHSAQDLLKKADGNLYKAKQAGRNQVCPRSI